MLAHSGRCRRLASPRPRRFSNRAGEGAAGTGSKVQWGNLGVPGRSRVHPWACPHGRERGCHRVALVNSFPPPPIPPPSFTWPPCQPSAVPNFHAAPKVGSWLRCGGHGCFLGGFRSQRGLGLSLPTVATLWGEEAWPNEPLLTCYFLYFLWYTLPWWAEGMRSAVGSVHVMIGSHLFSSSGPWDTSRDKVSPGHAPSPLRQKYPPGS